MKMRKVMLSRIPQDLKADSSQTLAHQALIQETVAMISPQFVPKVSHIKQAIDHLIDKEYLERAEGSRDT
jgi:cullin 1